MRAIQALALASAVALGAAGCRCPHACGGGPKGPHGGVPPPGGPPPAARERGEVRETRELLHRFAERVERLEVAFREMHERGPGPGSGPPPGFPRRRGPDGTPVPPQPAERAGPRPEVEALRAEIEKRDAVIHDLRRHAEELESAVRRLKEPRREEPPREEKR